MASGDKGFELVIIIKFEDKHQGTNASHKYKRKASGRCCESSGAVLTK